MGIPTKWTVLTNENATHLATASVKDDCCLSKSVNKLLFYILDTVQLPPNFQGPNNPRRFNGRTFGLSGVFSTPLLDYLYCTTVNALLKAWAWKLQIYVQIFSK
jgi:hypothetical protein